MHCLPLDVCVHAVPSKSMAAESVQLRAEFNHVTNIREVKLSWKGNEAWIHPGKCSSLERDFPTKYDTHALDVLVVLLQERENSKGRCYAKWLTLRNDRMQHSALYRNTSICIHGCIFLSGRGCITDASKVSALELLTTAPCSLSCTSHHRQH